METVGNDFKLSSTHPPLSRLVLPHARHLMVLGLMTADVIGFMLAGWIAMGLRFLVVGPLPLENFQWMTPMILVALFVFTVRGLYPSIGLGAVEEFHTLTITISTFFIITGSLVFLLRVEDIFSRLVYGLFWILSLGLVPFNRILMRHFLTRLGVWGEPTAIVGRPKAVRELVEYFRSYPKIGLRPVAVFLNGDEPEIAIPGLTVMRESDMDAFAGRDILHTALVAYDDLDEFSAIREMYRDKFERVILVNPRDGGIELGGVSVRQYGSLLSFEIRHTLMDQSAQVTKRLMDLAIAGVGVLILSPIFALIALLIRLDSPGSVFYKQKRLGKGGRVFNMLKFRTMHTDADAVLQSYLAENPEMREEWDRYQKLKNDPRITRVGQILRRFSLDELPQLLNVLIGEMSLVGPRPIMLNQEEMYGPNYKHYVRVVPGITGQWQISGRNHTSFAQRTDFDVQYVMNWSVWLDFYILVRTVWVVLKQDGAC